MPGCRSSRRPKIRRSSRRPRPPNRFPFQDVAMSSIAIPAPAQASHGGHTMTAGEFVRTYVFSIDHKIIGLQFLFSTLLWFLVGGLLALGIRWQLAWPWSNMPIIGPMLFSAEGGQISPEFYTTLFTMHATVLIFFVIIPILACAFGHYLVQ